MCEAPLNILRKVPYVPSVPPAFEEWEGMSAVSLIACENVSQAKTFSGKSGSAHRPETSRCPSL